MAWLDDFQNAPAITTEQAQFTNTFTMVYGDPPQQRQWTSTYIGTKRLIRCLTLTAAQAAYVFYNSQKHTTAIIRRLDDSGQYGVEISVSSHKLETAE